jgi:L-alanine-DL-glutamate epimerase-like enolase superfamily enzyme
MNITDVSAFVLRLPNVTDACDGSQDTCLIRITTDDGTIGWGEVDSCPTVVKAVVDAPLSHQICNGLGNILMGRDPLDIEACMRAMYDGANYYARVGVGAHAMAGVNIALWDIAGKAAGKPVHALLGDGGHDKYRAYCSILFGDTPAETYDLARRYVDEGFTAIKFGWGPMGQDEANDIALVREARRGAGDDVDVLVDAGQVWDWETALRRARQFEEFGLFLLEEPLQPEDIDGYRKLTAQSPIPIATGEAESELKAFKRLVLDGGLDWIQPDPGRCGISTFVAAGRYAHEHGAKVANHSFKSGITIAASLHALAAVPNGEIFEYCMSDSPLRQVLTKEKFEVVDGYVAVPQAPGLGVTIDEAVFDEYRVA